MLTREESDCRRAQGRSEGWGWISVNHYGALILNSNRVFFGDIDCIPDPRKPEKPVRQWAEAMTLIEFTAQTYGATFRVYRTFAGFRMLEISRQRGPRDPETHAMLSDLGCDSLYVLLTRRLRNFRVRLSPKPWRASAVPDFSSESDVDRYLATSPYAVAHYIGNVGPATITDPEIQAVANLHDEFCRSDSKLPLA